MINFNDIPEKILHTDYNPGSFKHIAHLMEILNLDLDDATVTVKKHDESTFPETDITIRDGNRELVLTYKEVTFPEYWRIHATYRYKCVRIMLDQSFR